MYRLIKERILKNISGKEVLILSGPRQIGKTTILKDIFHEDAIFIDLDDKIYRDFFDSLSLSKYNSFIDSHRSASKKDKMILILDEAQRMKDPGLCAKLFYDQIKNVKVILTGSSTLDIKKKTSESLAGRKISLNMFPLCLKEYLTQTHIDLVEIFGSEDFNVFDEKGYIDDINQNRYESILLERMKYGFYPGIIDQSPETYLIELIDSIILKDILYMNLVKNTNGLIDLLKILASNIGKAINVNEISKRINLSRKTINEYISILEKSYIIFTLDPYKGERKDEISKFCKVYFYDLGIRNALINDFRDVNIRSDYEEIFTNFIISEIKKLSSYYEKRYKLYYWKTTQGSQADLIIEVDNTIISFNISLYKNNISKGFRNTYTDATNRYINIRNSINYIL